jgi:CRP/FNR family transcriptional regulator
MGTARLCTTKEHVFREGDPATHVYRVEAGHVCVYRMTSDGRRQIVNFAFPGDIIGLGALGRHAANAQATSRTRLRAIPLGQLIAAARSDGALSHSLYEAVSRELIAARELLFTISQRTATERVAGFLVALARRTAQRGEPSRMFVLSMTRSDIADFLGLTIETVSRTLTKLRHERIIALEQNILVTVLDPIGLEKLADGAEAAAA